MENLTLASGTGNINATGNAANNVITGNEGNNRITGGAGTDTLTGNGGADTFVFNLPADGIDNIADFTFGTDKMEIAATGFGGGLFAGQFVELVNAAAASSATHQGSSSYFIFVNSGADAGTVYWDATGSSSADATAVVKLIGVTGLLPSDFHLV